ncbi:MAG: alpha/beta hydrolase [Halobacteriales archaeon]
METVTHHGRETAYRFSDRGGTGPSLLLIHGSGATHGAWKSQFRLADRFPVAALDLGGHGDSADFDADPGWTALSAYADDVLAVADAVDADVLVGNSLGGAVVQHIALERDPDFEGFVFVGTGARLAVLEDLRVWLAEDYDRAVEFLHEPKRLFYDPDEELVELSKAAMYEVGQAVTRRDYLTAHEFDVRDEVGDISTPSLALTGEHDQLTPPWYHEFLADELPDCAWTTIDDAAHLSMLERPAAFNETVTAFLEDLR